MNQELIYQEREPVRTVGRNILCLEEIDSTNDHGKRLVLEGAENGTVILADRQTAGRGRMDRRFQSPKGKGIYLTVLLRPTVPVEELASVTAMAGVAVCDAVERVCGVRPGLKWPNDPVLNGKKLGGILTELCFDPENGRPCVVLGIGLNVAHEEFPPEVAALATSLDREGCAVSREKLAAALIRTLDELFSALEAGDREAYLAAYRRDCVNLGKAVQLIRGGERETAEAVGIDGQFGLVVRTAGGEEKVVRSGEVSVRGMYGYVD